MTTRRRDLLTLLTLSALAPPVLAACGGAAQGAALVKSDRGRLRGDPALIPSAILALQALGRGLTGALEPAGPNEALSPYSIGVALGMAANGALGETRGQMLQVLGVRELAGLNGGLNALTAHVAGLAGTVEDAEGKEQEIALSSANQLFGERTAAWETAFLHILAESYGAGLRSVDYKAAPEAARRAMNAWAADRTRGRITEPVPPGAIRSNTRLALLNALYFKARWAQTFEKSSTRPAPFTTGAGERVQVETMHATQGLRFGEGAGWVAAQLPYLGDTLAMTVVLPTGDLTWADLPVGTVLASLRPAELVTLAMPRFTFRVRLGLKDALSALGMPLAFTGGADFGGMTRTEDLRISDVLHEVFIAVDEAGTEAAAVTAVIMRASGAVSSERRLVLDSPFLFVIHDLAHGTPLFLGRVTDPRD